MLNKSDCLMVKSLKVPQNQTIVQITTFNGKIIFATERQLYLHGEPVLIFQVDQISEIQYLYIQDDGLIIQTKQGMLIKLDEQFKEKWINKIQVFGFCKLSFIDDKYYFVDDIEHYLNYFDKEATKLDKFKYQSFSSQTQLKQNNNRNFLMATIDGYLIVVFEIKSPKELIKIQEHNLYKKDDPIFIYDSQLQIIDDVIQIVSITNQDSLIIINDSQQEVIKLKNKYNSVNLLEQNQIQSAFILTGHKNISLFSQKTKSIIMNFQFPQITNSFVVDEMVYFGLTDGSLGQIDLSIIKKKN
ncbi:hypothetical protein pb186bvf_014806 [Paramecium bursaria]